MQMTIIVSSMPVSSNKAPCPKTAGARSPGGSVGRDYALK
jgi:hypothetical protein